MNGCVNVSRLSTIEGSHTHHLARRHLEQTARGRPPVCSEPWLSRVSVGREHLWTPEQECSAKIPRMCAIGVLREPEVGEHGVTIFTNEDILGLDVLVNQSMRVQ